MMRKNEAVEEILKEIAGIGYSSWGRVGREFNCSIYREEVGHFKFCLRYDCSNVDLILAYDGIEAFILRIKKIDKDNRVIKLFNGLDGYFKEKVSMERQKVVDAFLNKK